MFSGSTGKSPMLPLARYGPRLRFLRALLAIGGGIIHPWSGFMLAMASKYLVAATAVPYVDSLPSPNYRFPI